MDVVLEGIRHQRYSCPESCCSSDTTVAVNFTLKNGSRSVCDRANILINRTDPVSVIVDLHSFFGEFHFGKTFIIAPESECLCSIQWSSCLCNNSLAIL